MHIDVNDILRQGEGHQAEFQLDNERPELEGIMLASPISGSLRLIAVDDGVVASGQLATDVRLECMRCLRTFEDHLEVPLDTEFMVYPGEDQFPIDRFGKVDLAEPIRQEIDIHLPLAPLCQVDCKGIE